MPLHLRELTPEQLWGDFRRNDSNLWQFWDVDFDNGLVPSMLEAAELIDGIDAVGGEIHINLDVTVPNDVELDEEVLDAIHDNELCIKELLRFNREADYNLRELADQ